MFLLGIFFEMQIWMRCDVDVPSHIFQISCFVILKLNMIWKMNFPWILSFYFNGKLCNWFSFWALLSYMLLKWDFQLVLIYSSSCLSMINNILRNLINVSFNSYIWELPSFLPYIFFMHYIGIFIVIILTKEENDVEGECGHL